MLEPPDTLTTAAFRPPPSARFAEPARYPETPWLWLVVLGPALLGYAILGKGWAYVGASPIYVGEVALLSGLGWLVVSGEWRRSADATGAIGLVALGGWGAVRTFPYLSVHGVDALRDAAVWGYGAFALIVSAGLLADPRRLAILLRWYRRFTRIFLPAIPVVWLLRRFAGDALPCWPGTDVPYIDAKGGDVFVHLGGILAFWVAGFEGPVSAGRVALMAFCVAIVGTFDRAGLVTYLAVFALCIAHRPLDRSLWRIAAAAVLGVAVLAAADVHIQMPGREREISAEQIVNNVLSVATKNDAGDLDGTKRWRLEWWGTIVDYTLFGEFLWDGKGFGVNLADDDGFQCNDDGSVRNPHNVHLTFLARAGLPGLALWVLAQGVWAAGVLRGYLRARMAADWAWAGLFFFLGTFWTAFLINASFDVYLEGPMGGTWFWTVYGVGLAAVRIHRTDPGVLPPDPSPRPTAAGERLAPAGEAAASHRRPARPPRTTESPDP